MEELNHFVLGKGPFASVKGHIFFTKRTLRQSRGAGGGRNLLNRKLFLNSLIEIKKSKIFFKKGTFNKASNPRMLYLSKIGPEKKRESYSIVMITKASFSISTYRCIVAMEAMNLKLNTLHR